MSKAKTHTLYLSAGGLLVLAFDKQAAWVANSFELPDDESGLEHDWLNCADALAFRAWVESQAGARFQLLIDHVDEQHAIEKIPRLGFRDRAALLAKRFNQQFRDSEFRTTSRIPRQPGDSRKEERLVMMALKSSVNLYPWLDILVQSKARVSLMTSPSLLSSPLIKSIAPGQSGLLISRHPAGLRQTLIIDGSVRFSRLARLKAYDNGSVRAEILRSIQYLTMTQRLSQAVINDAGFTVWLLEDGIVDAHHLPASLILDSGSAVAVRRLGAAQLGMPAINGAEGLSVWARLCQVRPGELNYVNKRVNFFQRLALWRWRLWTGAAVIAGAGLLMALLADTVIGWHGDRMTEVRGETSRLQSQIAQLRGQLGQFPATPEDIVAAVRTSQRLIANEVQAVKLSGLVSQALSQTQGLTLTGISFAAYDPAQMAGNTLGGSAGKAPDLLANRLQLIVTGLADREMSRTAANDQIRLLADALLAQCPCSIGQLDLPFDASAQSGLTASLNGQYEQNREFKVALLHQQPAGAVLANRTAYPSSEPGLQAGQVPDLISAMSADAMEAERE